MKGERGVCEGRRRKGGEKILILRKGEKYFKSPEEEGEK